MLRLTHRKTILTFTALALCHTATALAQTLPAGASVASGSATVSSHGPRKIVVDQGSERAVINWSSFSLSRDARIEISQPSIGSVLLNRVTGSQASQIDGTLTANGRVWIVNPQGVYFGAGSSVQVGALLVSSLAISDEDFNAGRYRFSMSGSPAPVQLDGTIQVPAGTGSVVALAPSITQSAQGVIQAAGGQVQLIAHDNVELQLDASGLITARLGASSTQSILNSEGRITVDNGMVLLSAQGSARAGTSLLTQSGVIDAGSVTTRGGRVFLESGGALELTGQIVAEGTGGSVQVHTVHGGIPAGSNGSISVPSADRLMTSVSFTAPPQALTARGAALAPDGTGHYDLAAAKAAVEESGKVGRKSSGDNRDEAAAEQSTLSLSVDPAVQQADATMPAPTSSPGQSADSSSGITGVVGNQGNDKLVGNAGGGRGGSASSNPQQAATASDTTLSPTASNSQSTPSQTAQTSPTTSPGQSADSSSGITGVIGNQGNDKPVGNAGGAGGGGQHGGGSNKPTDSLPPVAPVPPVAVIDPPTSPVPPTTPVSPTVIDSPAAPVPPNTPVPPVAVIDPPPTNPVPPTTPVSPTAIDPPVSPVPPTTPVPPVAVIDPPPTNPVPPTTPVSPTAIDPPVSPVPPNTPVPPVAVIDPPVIPAQPVTTPVNSSLAASQATPGNGQAALTSNPYRGMPQSAFALYDLRAGKPAWLGNFRAQIDADQMVLSASRSKSTPAAVHVPVQRAGVRFELPSPGAQSLHYVARHQGNGVVIAALDSASAFALDAQGKAIAANGLVALAQHQGTDLGLVRSVSLGGVGQ